MSLKAKLVTSISAFCLVLALLIVGVLAVPSATINMGGTITFSATDVNATVSITVTGTTEGTQPSQTYTFKAGQGNATEEWKSNNWTYDAGRQITITITVTNNDTARDLIVSYTAPVGTGFTNTTLGGSPSASDVTLDDATTGAAGSSNKVTYTITFAPKDQNLSASAAWTASLVLEDPSVAG